MAPCHPAVRRQVTILTDIFSEPEVCTPAIGRGTAVSTKRQTLPAIPVAKQHNNSRTEVRPQLFS